MSTADSNLDNIIKKNFTNDIQQKRIKKGILNIPRFRNFLTYSMGMILIFLRTPIFEGIKPK
jgi:hypothetical protein